MFTADKLYDKFLHVSRNLSSKLFLQYMNNISKTTVPYLKSLHYWKCFLLIGLAALRLLGGVNIKHLNDITSP